MSTSLGKWVSMKELDGVMEFDHPIRVHADGTVSDAEPNVYAPEVYDDGHGEIDGQGEWELMVGYTGQYAYRGPCMHSSEYIGGRMAADILATPGVYVATVVSVLECEYCEEGADNEEPCNVNYPHERGCLPGCACEPECLGEHEPAGWAVAFIADDDEPSEPSDPDTAWCNGNPANSSLY